MAAKITVQCRCGRKLSVSSDSTATGFRCPICRHKVRVQVEAPTPAMDPQEAPSAAEKAAINILANVREEAAAVEGLIDDSTPSPDDETWPELPPESDGAPVPSPPPVLLRDVSPSRPVAEPHPGAPAQDPAPAPDVHAPIMQCDNCKSFLDLPSEGLGKLVKCPHCLHTMPVPTNLRVEPEEPGRVKRLLSGRGAIRKSLTSAIMCVCQGCGIRYVLGVNAAAIPAEETVKKLGVQESGRMVGRPSQGVPDKISLTEDSETWPEGEELPEPTEGAPRRIRLARDRHESRQWRCGACLQVQKYEW